MLLLTGYVCRRPAQAKLLKVFVFIYLAYLVDKVFILLALDYEVIGQLCGKELHKNSINL